VYQINDQLHIISIFFFKSNKNILMIINVKIHKYTVNSELLHKYIH